MQKKFRCSWIALLMILTLAFGLNIVNAATLFSDNFEDGNSTGWSTSGGSWSVVTDGTRVYKQSRLSSTAHA
jgi:pectate lyase